MARPRSAARSLRRSTRCRSRPSGASADDLRAAARGLLARDRLPRERLKGGEAKTYDLRPLLVTLDVGTQTDSDVEVRMRTRIHPELGTGRPEEVVAALASELGADLAIERIVRERLLLADELEGSG